MRRLAVVALGATVIAGIAGTAGPAYATDCSASTPGTLTLEKSFGLEDGRVRLQEASGARQDVRFEYKVDGCELPAQEFPATVIGPSEDSKLSARLVPKGPKSATLIVNFAANTLVPGNYEMSVVSGTRALPLSQPVNVDVKAGGWEPWGVVAVAAALGLLALAMRSAAAKTTGGYWPNVRKYFTTGGFALPLLGGAVGVAPGVFAAYIANPQWFATGPQLFTLLGAVFAGMTAGGTVVAATTKQGT